MPATQSAERAGVTPERTSHRCMRCSASFRPQGVGFRVLPQGPVETGSARHGCMCGGVDAWVAAGVLFANQDTGARGKQPALMRIDMADLECCCVKWDVPSGSWH